MQNGSGINPSAYTSYFSTGLGIQQGNLILKKPNSNNLYYFFHTTLDTFPAYTHSKNLYLSIIDMSLNSGLGSVITKNQILLTDSMVAGKLAACKHSNGRDWWVVCQKLNSNRLFKFLVLPSAILGPYIQDIGIQRYFSSGQAYFSPDGSKYAVFGVAVPGVPNLEIFDFNRCTGNFSNPLHAVLPYNNGYQSGISFSPNSDNLYLSNVTEIYQYDLTAANVLNSKIIVAVYDSFLSVSPGFPGLETIFCFQLLAPDGKIYITTGNSTMHMHTIDNPDLLGLACSVNQHSVQLQSIAFNTLPNHPNYFLGCDTTLGCGCLTGLEDELTLKISATATPNPTNNITTFHFPVQKIKGSLWVYDLLGNMVMEESITQWSQYKQVNFSLLPSGIYMCKLRWNKLETSIKILKE
ncbi:MAG: T9SS type A sorting domain-containing protein [Bacteroidetes bacterium]|nr:T9SS type A sorting domain-containing protein [Bacteroidota bacterium]